MVFRDKLQKCTYKIQVHMYFANNVLNMYNIKLWNAKVFFLSILNSFFWNRNNAKPNNKPKKKEECNSSCFILFFLCTESVYFAFVHLKHNMFTNFVLEPKDWCIFREVDRNTEVNSGGKNGIGRKQIWEYNVFISKLNLCWRFEFQFFQDNGFRHDGYNSHNEHID